jgi:hypothetical protein
VPEQEEGCEHRSGVVEHFPLQAQGHREAVEPADPDGQRYQHVHVERGLAKRGNGAGEEHPRDELLAAAVLVADVQNHRRVGALCDSANLCRD